MQKFYTLIDVHDDVIYYFQNWTKEDGKMNFEFTDDFQQALLTTTYEEMTQVRDLLHEKSILPNSKVATITIDVKG